eukprot:350193-Chlamydomonas_euryale.AAC.7
MRRGVGGGKRRAAECSVRVRAVFSVNDCFGMCVGGLVRNGKGESAQRTICKSAPATAVATAAARRGKNTAAQQRRHRRHPVATANDRASAAAAPHPSWRARSGHAPGTSAVRPCDAPVPTEA